MPEITDGALPWVIGIGGLAASAAGALLAVWVDHLIQARPSREKPEAHRG